MKTAISLFIVGFLRHSCHYLGDSFNTAISAHLLLGRCMKSSVFGTFFGMCRLIKCNTFIYIHFFQAYVFQWPLVDAYV